MHTDQIGPSHSSARLGALLAELSRKIVAIDKERVGKGPVHARASLSNNGTAGLAVRPIV